MSNDFIKKFSAFLVATTASVLILSVAYIIAESNHDCTGDDCSVCVCIEQCLNNFRTLGTSDEMQAEIFIVEKFSEPPIFIYVCLILSITLINSKVRLDN